MPVDAAAQGIIDALSGSTPFEKMTVDEARAAVASFAGLQKPHREVSKVVDAEYPGPAGPQKVRIYIPESGKPGSDKPLPVVVYFHGGGFIAGDLAVAEEPNRALAIDAGVIVVAASYRLAPEHPFPAATDDTFAALQWVADSIGEYGGDASRIAVMGDSAGGNLAAVAAQRWRDEGRPALSAQVLVYPVIDSTAELASRADFKDGFVISAADLDAFWAHYLPGPEDAENPRATPSRAASLAGLAPALVISTEFEVARDEAEAYAAQLAAAAVPTETLRVDGLIHGTYWMSGAVPRSNEIHEAVVKFLRQRFAA
ncbi:alpha/beta hydrolase [Arthrobacter sp. PAMC25564]|uniref:alpha/beta hydrolase n=1 Tax=Arthrobacter sp. PAMC25564 TaxID=2565366 RepID=UPI0010A27B32|nr:alpha/beta hydrolase [Arthrobacter sp. PAMC25564]QCB96535.1 alpha/beta hydrolase [Arthrobacter sp. PAMC25564]